MSNRKLCPWTVRNVKKLVLEGNVEHLALRCVTGNAKVREAINLVLDEELLTQDELKELESHLVRWLELKRRDRAFIARLRAQDFLDSI